MHRRYLKVRGKPGVLVEGADVPAFPAEKRFVGKVRIPNAPAGGGLVDQFTECDEVVVDDPYHHLRRACKDGDLEILGQCVAETHAEATAKLNAASPKAAPKKTEA